MSEVTAADQWREWEARYGLVPTGQPYPHQRPLECPYPELLSRFIGRLPLDAVDGYIVPGPFSTQIFLPDRLVERHPYGVAWSARDERRLQQRIREALELRTRTGIRGLGVLLALDGRGDFDVRVRVEVVVVGSWVLWDGRSIPKWGTREEFEAATMGGLTKIWAAHRQH